jgi:hypothetical protein
MVRQGDVDGVDGFVGEDGVVAAVTASTVTLREGVRGLLVSATDGDQAAGLRAGDAAGEEGSDAPGAEDPPTDPSWSLLPSAAEAAGIHGDLLLSWRPRPGPRPAS